MKSLNQIKKQIVIKSEEYQIQIDAPISLVDQILNSDFYKTYIPNSEVISHSDNIDFCLNVVDSEEFSFEFKNQEAILSGEFNLELTFRSIVVTAEYCLNYVRQLHNEYVINGSAVSKGKKGIILIGNISGLGKTTTTVNLCTKNNFKFIADDKVLVNNKFEVMGGARYLHFNKQDLFKSLDTKFNNLDTDGLSQFIEIDKGKSTIKAFVIPILIQGIQETSVQAVSLEEKKYILYELFTRKIRGCTLRLYDFNYPLQSIDTHKLSLQRSKFVNELANKVDLYMIKGNLPGITNAIQEIVTMKD